MALALGVSGCTQLNPEYCESDRDCLDTERPYCDIPGIHPAAGGLNNYCIPDPRDAGSEGTADSGRPASDGRLPDGVDAGLLNGQECDGPEVCASENCVDGVCCAQPCDGLCEACNVEGFIGQCAALPAGQGEQECAGADPACTGSCDGQRACRYDTKKICKKQCDWTGPGRVEVFLCTTNGACSRTADPTPEKSCAFSVCSEEDRDANCTVTCESHDDCVADSLCDRTEAHRTGHGDCVDPADIAELPFEGTRTATGDESLSWLIDVAAIYGSRYIRVGPRPANDAYVRPRSWRSSKPLVLVGLAGAEATVFDPTGGLHAFTVSDGGSLTLQGITVADANSHGITCAGGSAVTLVESVLRGSGGLGLHSDRCTATVRRSTIDGNHGGGLDIVGGIGVITNSAILDNGTTGDSDLGGLSVSGGADLRFASNTVVSNHASGKVAGGVICSARVPLVNSIIAGNDNVQTSTCEVPTSSVEGSTREEACALNAETLRPTTGPCIDGGDNNQVEDLQLDAANAPRVQGDAVDIGAYEAQK